MFHLIIKTKVDYVFQIKKNLVMAKYLMDGADLEMMKKIGSASITTIWLPKAVSRNVKQLEDVLHFPMVLALHAISIVGALTIMDIVLPAVGTVTATPCRVSSWIYTNIVKINWNNIIIIIIMFINIIIIIILDIQGMMFKKFSDVLIASIHKLKS